MTVLAAFTRFGYLPIVPPITETDPPEEPTEPIAAPPAWIDHPAITETVTGFVLDNETLYIAHAGNWTGGSHYIATVDLVTGTPVTGPLVPTEGFATVHKIANTIYLTWADPTGAWNAPQAYSFTEDGGNTWQEKRVAPAYHFFDMVEFGGSLWLSGSGPNEAGEQRALVWRSDDAGLTWSESLAVAGTTPRMTAVYIAGGILWARMTGPSGIYRWDGTQWNSSGLIPSSNFLPRLSHNGAAYGHEDVFDGARAVAYTPHRPVWADATNVYAINQATGFIDRAPLLAPTDTEVTWEPWLDLGPGMTGYVAITALLHDGYVYVGGTEGRIWRYTAPA